MQKSTGEVVGLDYWMQWQVPVCGLIIVAPAAVAIKLIRALAFLSMTWLLYQTLLFAGTFAFYFYTQWTFALVLVYFAVGTIMSARGCLISSDRLQIRTTEKDKLQKNGLEAKRKSNNNLQNHKSNGEAYQGAGFLASVMQILYQTSAGASVLTDLVFWCVLVPMHSGIDFELTLLIGCLHSVNVVILVIDSLLNALPFQWFGFNYFILWTVTYAVFQWIRHACGSTWWPYPFLELATPWAPLWYLGMALIHVPCYGLYLLFVKTKNSIFSTLFPEAFLRSHGGMSRHKKAA